MKKDLPSLYRGNISNGASNNLKVAHGLKEKSEPVKQTIDRLFKENRVYRQDVELETNGNVLTTKIIGRTQDHIITINNSVIKIDDITSLKIVK